jgi:transcriptional regulator with XRE-family HTH domain
VRIPKRQCVSCAGTGRQIDSVLLGPLMQQLRNKSGMTQAAVAERMGVSVGYVIALESGNRNWNDELIRRFQKAVK